MGADNLDTLCFIQEQTSFPEDYKTEFGYTVHKRDGNRFYVVFDSVLQSFGVMNRNRRKYVLENIRDQINNDVDIQTMLRHNSWIGEIDHPEPTIQGQELSMSRIAKPDMKNSSHYIRNPRFNGNLLEATIQTDSGTQAGMNMAIKIVDGKIVPCFSARVLGSLQNENNDPVVYVKKLICYDWVLCPSHQEAEAKIHQPMITESVDIPDNDYENSTIIFLPQLARMAANNSKETEWLCESFGLSIDNVIGLTKTGNSLIIEDANHKFIQPIMDKDVRNAVRNTLNDILLS